MINSQAMGAKIKQARIAQNLSVAELARKIGIKPQLLESLEELGHLGEQYELEFDLAFHIVARAHDKLNIKLDREHINVPKINY